MLGCGYLFLQNGMVSDNCEKGLYVSAGPLGAAAESCMAAAECGFIWHLMLHQFRSCYELFKMHHVSCSKYCKA